jgi:ribosomal protein L11 methyltransferase
VSREYIEVSISIEPFSQENAEIVEAALCELPYESFVIDDPADGSPVPGLKAYIPKDLYDSSRLKLALSGLAFGTKFLARLVPQEDWNRSWEEEFEPITVDGKVTVKSPRHKGLPRTRFNITIEPHMAFGTGHHETTFMMVQAMLENEASIRGGIVLDMGCGTAVLAILAAKMGAEHVFAIDIDAVAAQSAFDNSRLNRVSKKIEAYCGDASLIQAGKYDVLLANIHKNVILTDIKTYAGGLRKGGLLAVSGFFETDADDIMEEAGRWNLIPLSSKALDGWSCLQFRKK